MQCCGSWSGRIGINLPDLHPGPADLDPYFSYLVSILTIYDADEKINQCRLALLWIKHGCGSRSGSALFLESGSGSGSALMRKVGSGYALQYSQNSKALEAHNRALECVRLTMEAGRLKMEPWRVLSPVVADSHHFKDEVDPETDPH